MKPLFRFSRHSLLIFPLFLGSIVVLPMAAKAAAWPEGYVVHQGTESPDGHYGIAVPTVGAEDSGTGENVNYLADLKTHQVLGKIACDDYFEGENHFHLRAVWAPDFKWCVVIYNGRYGFSSMAILVPKGSRMTESNIGERIDDSLKAAAGDEGYGSVYFRFAAGRKLLVRALSFTGNPKQNDANTRYARFQGTFDINSGKWTNIDAQRMNLPGPHGDDDVYSEVYTAVGTAYSDVTPDDFSGKGADDIDELMNDVYQGVRAVLPPGRFAKVKKDQIEWLKKRDAISTVDDKCKFAEARIKVLQDLLW